MSSIGVFSYPRLRNSRIEVSMICCRGRTFLRSRRPATSPFPAPSKGWRPRGGREKTLTVTWDPRRDAFPLGEHHGLARESLLPVRGEQKHVEHTNQL